MMCCLYTVVLGSRTQFSLTTGNLLLYPAFSFDDCALTFPPPC
jgi:hypothetical protein